MSEAAEPVIDDLVILLGRVHALTPGGMLCVETATGGFVWLMPDECERLSPIPPADAEQVNPEQPA